MTGAPRCPKRIAADAAEVRFNDHAGACAECQREPVVKRCPQGTTLERLWKVMAARAARTEGGNR